MELILRNELEIKRYLYGTALDLADQLGCFHHAIKEMESMFTLRDYELLIEEMERELERKKGIQTGDV